MGLLLCTVMGSNLYVSTTKKLSSTITKFLSPPVGGFGDGTVKQLLSNGSKMASRWLQGGFAADALNAGQNTRNIQAAAA